MGQSPKLPTSLRSGTLMTVGREWSHWDGAGSGLGKVRHQRK
jgi:hypothetical protein